MKPLKWSERWEFDAKAIWTCCCCCCCFRRDFFPQQYQLPSSASNVDATTNSQVSLQSWEMRCAVLNSFLLQLLTTIKRSSMSYAINWFYALMVYIWHVSPSGRFMSLCICVRHQLRKINCVHSPSPLISQLIYHKIGMESKRHVCVLLEYAG